MRPVDTNIETYYTTWPDGDRRYTAFMLVELVGASVTYRFTDAPLPIVWNGYTWTNCWFLPSEFVIDGDGEVAGTVVFEDATRTIRTLAMSTDLSQFVLKLYEVWADATNTKFGQDEIVRGQVEDVTCDAEDTEFPVATITLTSVFASSAAGMGPRQMWDKNCTYEEFKGPECGAVTAATFCDRLYGTCVGFGNQKRYGGARFVLGEGETIAWGVNTGKTTTRPVRAPEPPPPSSGAPPPTSYPVIPNTPGRTRSARH